MDKKSSMPEIQVHTTGLYDVGSPYTVPGYETAAAVKLNGHHPAHPLRSSSFEQRRSSAGGEQRRSYGSCGSSTASPETEEFESLERRLTSELEQKLAERRESEHRRISQAHAKNIFISKVQFYLKHVLCQIFSI